MSSSIDGTLEDAVVHHLVKRLRVVWSNDLRIKVEFRSQELLISNINAVRLLGLTRDAFVDDELVSIMIKLGELLAHVFVNIAVVLLDISTDIHELLWGDGFIALTKTFLNEVGDVASSERQDTSGRGNDIAIRLASEWEKQTHTTGIMDVPPSPLSTIQPVRLWFYFVERGTEYVHQKTGLHRD